MNKNKSKKVLINRNILSKEVSVVLDKENLGVMSTHVALDMAFDRKLDLVQVSDSQIPTCRLMDYKKYQYEQNKKNAQIRKKSKIHEIKEIQIKPKIGQHDFETKIKHARRFIDAGNKVKVVLRLRGREMIHVNLNIENILKKFADSVNDIAKVEKDPKQEMKNRISMTLKPNA